MADRLPQQDDNPEQLPGQAIAGEAENICTVEPQGQEQGGNTCLNEDQEDFVPADDVPKEDRAKGISLEKEGGAYHVYNPEVAANFLQLIREGNTREIAARAVGLSWDSLRSWLQTSKMENCPPEMRSFGRMLTISEAEAESGLVGIVSRAAKKDPKCAMWMLERIAPERWGKDVGSMKRLRSQVKRLRSQVEAMADSRESASGGQDAVGIPVVAAAFLVDASGTQEGFTVPEGAEVVDVPQPDGVPVGGLLGDPTPVGEDDGVVAPEAPGVGDDRE